MAVIPAFYFIVILEDGLDYAWDFTDPVAVEEFYRNAALALGTSPTVAMASIAVALLTALQTRTTRREGQPH